MAAAAEGLWRSLCAAKTRPSGCEGRKHTRAQLAQPSDTAARAALGALCGGGRGRPECTAFWLTLCPFLYFFHQSVLHPQECAETVTCTTLWLKTKLYKPIRVPFC